jgi:hypothetical protein
VGQAGQIKEQVVQLCGLLQAVGFDFVKDENILTERLSLEK